jgi:hypothetical protein
VLYPVVGLFLEPEISFNSRGSKGGSSSESLKHTPAHLHVVRVHRGTPLDEARLSLYKGEGIH